MPHPLFFSKRYFSLSTVQISSFPPFFPLLIPYIRDFCFNRSSYLFPNQAITYISPPPLGGGQNKKHTPDLITLESRIPYLNNNAKFKKRDIQTYVSLYIIRRLQSFHFNNKKKKKKRFVCNHYKCRNECSIIEESLFIKINYT